MAQDREQVRVGLIGYGEVGNGLGSGLRGAGLEHVIAYDIAAFEGPFSELIRSRAADAGVTLVRSPRELAEGADYIIVAVPGNECVPAAEAIADHLTARHVYVDIGSATPAVKRAVGERLERSGARVGDGGIMSSPLDHGYRVIIKASGPAAQAFQDVFVPWGMRIEAVSPRLGDGSGIKIVRSIVMKGMEALLVECAVCSARYGIQDLVFDSISETMDARPYRESIAFLLRTDVIHAERRAEEAAMSADACEEVGLEPVMTRRTSEMLQRVADMNLKEHFAGVVPDDYRVAVEAIDSRLRGEIAAR
jgi:3-hydroxyisobutyrate dehydrogenase-like beta-hydroxyacid dehydrogenase